MLWNIITFCFAGPAHILHISSYCLDDTIQLFVFFSDITGMFLGTDNHHANLVLSH